MKKKTSWMSWSQWRQEAAPFVAVNLPSESQVAEIRQLAAAEAVRLAAEALLKIW